MSDRRIRIRAGGFPIPVEAAEAADARATVDKGAVAYWPPGSALCLFWGPTPMSRGDEIRPASAVNVLGAIDGDPTVLGRVRSGTEIVVERAEWRAREQIHDRRGPRTATRITPAAGTRATPPNSRPR